MTRQIAQCFAVTKMVDKVNYLVDNRGMTSPHVAVVRAFNRFYTRRIGVLGEKHLDSHFSLTEVRILYELAHRTSPIAAEIARDLSLDRGYLSRILRSFQRRGLVSRKRAPEDGRQSRLTLTAKGRQA